MSGKEASVKSVVGRIFCVMLMAAGVADLCGLFRSTAASGAFALMGGSGCAGADLRLSAKKWDIPVLRFGGKLLILAVILELTVFQYPSYRSVFGSGSETVFSPELRASSIRARIKRRLC